jgi:hypothetical protein
VGASGRNHGNGCHSVKFKWSVGCSTIKACRCSPISKLSDEKPTKRSELRRMPARESHDWNAISHILDAGFIAHVGFSVDNQPFVIPTLYGRRGERLYLHGSAASRMLRELETGIPACVTVTLVDGLVLSRPAFHHSMNYRSANEILTTLHFVRAGLGVSLVPRSALRLKVPGVRFHELGWKEPLWSIGTAWNPNSEKLSLISRL